MCTALFVWDLVRNSEDRFSCNVATITIYAEKKESVRFHFKSVQLTALICCRESTEICLLCSSEDNNGEVGVFVFRDSGVTDMGMSIVIGRAGVGVVGISSSVV